MKTQEFIAKLNAENQELVDKINAAGTREEMYEIAKSEGVTDSFEAFDSEMEKLSKTAAELSDDDLDNVAGGRRPPEANKSKLR